MKKKLLFILFSILYLHGFSQVVYEKSSDIETIDGQKFYIHTVEKKQTVYSISKLYAVSINDIYTFNPKAKTDFLIGIKLKIPIHSGEEVVQKNPQPVTEERKVRPSENKKATNADFIKGKELLESKNYDEAISSFSKAIETGQSPQSYYYRGRIYFIKEKFQDAADDFSSYLKSFPTDGNAYNDCGSAKLKLNDLDGALENYTKAASLNPSIDFIFDNLGTIKKLKGDTAGALKAFSKAIELKADNYVAYNNRGSLKFAQKDYTGAGDDFSEAIKINPQYSIAYNNRGNTRIKTNDYAGAIADLDKAIELNPSYGNAFLNRGIANEKLNNSDKACQDWSKALSLGIDIAEKYISKQCK